MSESVREQAERRFKAVEDAAVRQQLERILESAEFKSSKRCQEFLRFVTERALAGHADELKERTIGVELLGRAASYDPSTDASVRVKAGEVRRRLQTYYSGTGAQDEIRVHLPAGGYVPEFSIASPAPPPPVLADTSHPAAAASHRWVIGLMVACVAACVAVGFFVWQWRVHGGAIEQFWAPALKGSEPVLLCVSSVPVYGLHPNVEFGGKRIDTPEDFVQLPNSFIGNGDVLALSRLTSLFGDLHHKYRVRLGNELSFHDLKDSPSVLIGYSYTHWNELNRGLRYLIDTSQYPFAITDNGTPTEWKLRNLKPDRSTDEDYAIVSRLLHLDTGDLVVIVAGMTQYGTEAASDLVTDPVRLKEVVQRLPDDWAAQNLQLVLHVRVISGAPGSTTVVASHLWN
jgi:hypothetical protein